MDQHKLGFSSNMQAILAAVRRPPKPGRHADITAGVVIGGPYTDWNKLTLLVQNPASSHADVQFAVRGYRVIGPDQREDVCSVSVSMAVGEGTEVARLSFPDSPVEPGKECYYGARLDFTTAAGDDGGEIESALFLVVDDKLTCHVVGGGEAA